MHLWIQSVYMYLPKGLALLKWLVLAYVIAVTRHVLVPSRYCSSVATVDKKSVEIAAYIHVIIIIGL